LLSDETWLLLLMKVDGAVVMYVAPVTETAGGSPAAARADVAAAAVDTGAAIAIALTAAAIGTRRARVNFLANLLLTFSNILNSKSVSGHVSL
jgi:hypothetical protein